MKKTLLLSVAVATALTASAQFVKNDMKLVKQQLPTLMVKQNGGMLEKASAESVSSRTADNGLYYVMNGGLWRGWGLDGYGMGFSVYNMAPWTVYTLDAVPDEGTWQGYNGSEWKEATDTDGNTIVGDREIEFYPGMFYAPRICTTTGTLIKRTITWQFGDNNVFYANDATTYAQFGFGVLSCDSIAALYPTDDHAKYMYQGKAYSNVAGWGLLDTDNLYGSGNYVDTDEDTGESTTYVSYAASQPYPALASPLYVEKIFVKGYSTSHQPIAEGKKLAIVISNSASKSGTYSDGTAYTNYYAGDVQYDTLYAESSDTLDFQTEDTRNSKTIYEGTVIFSKKTTDAFGNETIEPITIPAGEDFVIDVVGFNQEGIDFGPTGLEASSEDEACRPAAVCVTDGEDGYFLHYSSKLTLNMGIQGMFDKVYVPVNNFLKDEPEGYKINVLRVSADGKTVDTDGFADNEQYNLTYALVGTGMRWFDEEENENYTIECPDWITQINIDPEYYDSDNLPGFNFVNVECEPLPSGVTGRAAYLYVEGKGVKADNPIVILQGDAVDAIENVTVDKNTTHRSAKIFNIAGQNVNSSAKGILIQDGHKFINK